METVVLPNGCTMMPDPLVEHLRSENERLRIELRAERAQSDRLHAAVAHLKEALGAGQALLVHATQADMDCDAAKEVAATMQGRRDRADSLLLPLAEPS